MTTRWTALPARIPWPGRRLREEIQHLEAVVTALRVELDAARHEAAYERAEKHRQASEAAYWRHAYMDLEARQPYGHLEGRARVELHRDGTRIPHLPKQEHEGTAV